ncbi:hypothetical protein GPECTOR_33g636 [Gonium pectorale]|uniref:Uncharacterized protein n=1 Tax=Gonium pectorale TaxID=33097 RepID=A0A150GD34_GONPE|nr:hypothetical protein GPECTOR_33g636 [Gonium pectorale]|eukprot:KXZ47754.1 hypothetical protein GPECTOR_33g636 [Gonium pectorale]
MQQQFTGVKEQFTAVQEQLAGNTQQLATMQQQVTAVQEQLTGNTQQLATMQQQVTVAKEQVTAVQEQLAGNTQQLAAMQQQVTAVQEQLTGNTQQLTTVLANLVPYRAASARAHNASAPSDETPLLEVPIELAQGFGRVPANFPKNRVALKSMDIQTLSQLLQDYGIVPGPTVDLCVLQLAHHIALNMPR